jgi:exopolysaccharide production protein ExoZ
MQSEPKTDFVPFIQLLRGIAPLLVVWPHLAGAWPAVTTHEIWPGFLLFRNLVSKPFHLFQDGGHLGVVIFFLISGYIISHVAASQTTSEFVIKRVFRLAPALFVAVLSMAIGSAISARFHLVSIWGDSAQSLMDYVKSALLLDYVLDHKALALPPTWSLLTEVTFYACVALLMSLVWRRPVMSVVALLGVYICLMTPVGYSDNLNYFASYYVYFPLFVVGRIFYLENTKRLDRSTSAILFVWTLILYYLLYSGWAPSWLPPQETIATYVLAIAIFYAMMKSELRHVPKPLSFCADISYSLYLLHLPIGGLTMGILYSIGAPIGLIVFGGIAASLGAATLSWIFVEKPFQRLGRGACEALAIRREAPAVVPAE